MVLNTQSYMWDGIGMVGYLLGPTLRAPYGANKDRNKDGPFLSPPKDYEALSSAATLRPRGMLTSSLDQKT